MSTRANVVLQESYSYKNTKGRNMTKTDKLYFYRHSDGYPEGTLPSLNKFMDWLKQGLIRNDLSQGAGWLIVLGAIEYMSIPKFDIECGFPDHYYMDMDKIQPPKDWKVGAYEPTTGIHGDVQYVYVIDVAAKTLQHYTIDEYKQINGIK
jgi:hypothetical protein